LARQYSPEIPMEKQIEIMDTEIAFAKRAGVDYWAFCWPQGSDKMAGVRRELYEKNNNPDKQYVKYCAIFSSPELFWADDWGVMHCFRRDEYQTVLDGRPLIYLLKTGNQENAIGKFTPGDIRKMRDAAKPYEPYIVGLNGYVDGMDAVSRYATWSETQMTPYAALMESEQASWEADKEKCDHVIPIVTAGYDCRPRMEGYGFALYNLSSPWIYPPTENEFKEHLGAAHRWARNNSKPGSADSILIYSWNEFDEGGSCLCPTLYHGASMLDIVAEVKGTEGPVTEPLTAGVYKSGDINIVYGGAPDIVNKWQYDGVTHVSSTPGEYVKFTCNSGHARIHGKINFAEIWVDNKLFKNISTDDANGSGFLEVDAGNFLIDTDDKIHTYKIINKTDGSKAYLAVDEIEICD